MQADSKLTIYLHDLAKDREMIVKDVGEIMLEQNAMVRTRRHECQLIKLAQSHASTDAQE